ncbi:hypothetical protein CHS0354_026179 [Potamilus streckersoni]|uniref:CARD domain-containing protein n=1 Tax=Potamilus streckersoni TaxID=2493646 RepID=A0AAE0SB06_9BIVA|nr:hypothetical protein CHS0354_026179 [Potamilus streckersoni]
MMEKTSSASYENFKDIIRENYVKLRRDLDVSKIIPYFFQHKLLELHDMEENKSYLLQMDRADHFLQRCLIMNPSKAYEIFTLALRELNYEHILKIFEDYRKSRPTSATCGNDVEVQTDLTCFSEDLTPSSSFVCLNCRGPSFSNFSYGYDDALSLRRAPKLQTDSVGVEEDEHGYTLLMPRDGQDTEGEFRQAASTSRNNTEAKTTTGAETYDRTGLVYLTKAMSDSTLTFRVSEDMNHPDLAALKEEVIKLEGWRPDVNESNVKDKARAWEGQQGYYFLWWHKRSRRDSMTKSTRSVVGRHGRFIVSVWSKMVLLHYKILDKRDENQQMTYYVDKNFSSPSISKLIETWKENGVSVKQDRI